MKGLLLIAIFSVVVPPIATATVSESVSVRFSGTEGTELFCEGKFDPGAGYTVTARLDPEGHVQGVLHMDYADNDGFEFKHEVRVENAVVKAGQDFALQGTMDEGTMSLAGTWNSSSGKFDSSLSASGNMGEGFELAAICEIR